jgi:hypothetical protein
MTEEKRKILRGILYELAAQIQVIDAGLPTKWLDDIDKAIETL